MILCLSCRKEFTEAEIHGKVGCPACGDTGIPADTTETATLRLTTHEWRCVFIWAANHASSDPKMERTINGIVASLREKHPELPPLTLNEEFQQLADAFPNSGVEVRMLGKPAEVIPPKRKN